MQIFLKIIKAFGSVKCTVLCLIVLFIGVVGGTFYQVNAGLLAAQNAFFGSWGSFIFNVIPFPGLKTIAVVLTFNLIVSAVIKGPFTFKKTGLLLIHSGMGILLVGTGISSLFVKNSTLILCEGDRTTFTRDLNTWELIITNVGPNSGTSYLKSDTFDFSGLKHGLQISIPNTDLNATVDQLYSNCKGFGYSEDRIDSLEPLPSAYEKMGDLPGIILSINFRGETITNKQRIMLFGGMSHSIVYVINNDTLSFTLKPHELELPFEIQLVKFEKENHPGSSAAKSYKSFLKVNGEGIDRDVVISMNRPFRYKSLAIYQSGFSQNTTGNCSSMIVVENIGRIIPYIAGTTVVTGLFIYFLMMFIASCKYLRKNGSNQ